MSVSDKRMKCRYCAVTFLKKRKHKSGRTIDGFDNVRDHMMLYHPEEFDELQRKLDAAGRVEPQ